MKTKFYSHIVQLQKSICDEFEKIDGKAKFFEDKWTRDGGGGGITKIIEDGKVIEKGGVNISKVFGELPQSMQKQLNTNSNKFFACGLSLVIHPINPMVPTVHANWRYFEMYDDDGNITDSWFGGGQDLTPYYIFENDIEHFHKQCKTICRLQKRLVNRNRRHDRPTRTHDAADNLINGGDNTGHELKVAG